jgi:hypothetical protein
MKIIFFIIATKFVLSSNTILSSDIQDSLLDKDYTPIFASQPKPKKLLHSSDSCKDDESLIEQVKEESNKKSDKEENYSEKPKIISLFQPKNVKNDKYDSDCDLLEILNQEIKVPEKKREEKAEQKVAEKIKRIYIKKSMKKK